MKHKKFTFFQLGWSLEPLCAVRVREEILCFLKIIVIVARNNTKIYLTVVSLATMRANSLAKYVENVNTQIKERERLRQRKREKWSERIKQCGV